MDSQPIAGPSSRQIEGEEVDVEWLQLVRTNHDVNVRVADKIPLDDLPQECNLLAVSNTWGLVIVGGQKDVHIHRLSEFHSQLEGAAKDATPSSSPVQTLTLPARPVWVRLAMNEERLLVSTANSTGLHIYRLADILRGQTSPYHSFTTNIPSHLIDLLPNPAVDALGRYVALVGKEGMVLADIEEKRLLDPVHGPFTSGCWSAKGKQIVLGMPDGRLVQYTPEGVAKAEIPPPISNSSSYPSFVQWLDTNLFLVGYAPTNGRPDDSLDLAVINRTKTEITYTKFYDPLNTMGIRGRSGAFRYYAGLRNWGSRSKHLSFVMSGLASEVGIMQGTMDEAGVPKWEVLILDEGAKALMPIGKRGVSEDTACIGMDLDLTSDKVIRRGIVGGIETPDLAPAPRLLVFSQNGVVISFNIQNSEASAGAYPGMVVPRDILSDAGGDEDGMSTAISTPGAVTPTPAAPNPTAFGGFGSSFGTAASASSAFGAGPPPAFGGFGQSSSASANTPSSAFGSSAAPSSAGSAFGQQSTAPATTPVKAGGFGGFGQSSTPSAFGAPAFGQQPSFGQSSTPAATSTTPTTTPAKSSAFGQSGFGQSSTPTPAASAFGAPAFGAKPAFGQSSTPSAFGQPAFSQSPSATSAFGSVPSPSSGGFGAFGNSKPAAAQLGFGFGSAPFGSSGQKPGGGSAFGSGSAFGQSGFGSGQPAKPQPQATAPAASTGAFAGFGQQNSAGSTGGFAGFGQQSESVSTAPTPPPRSSTDDFGLDSFASALETSSKQTSSKPTVSGLDDSPPSSPVLGSRKPTGIDEFDSPPNSPPITSPPKPMPQQAVPSNPSSAFIKPATAFGSSSSAFTGFGQQSASPKVPAFGSGNSTPAFGSTTRTSTTPPSGQPSATAFGSSAFGQTSKPAPPPTTFGGSAFGQSSKPVAGAFGQTAPTTGGFASITGGFGGFAPKASGSATTIPAAGASSSSGFGGFGASAASRPGSSGGFGFAAASGSATGGGFGALLTGKGEEKPKPASSSAFGSGSAFGATSSFGTAKAEDKPRPASPSTPPAPVKEETPVDPAPVKTALPETPLSPVQSPSSQSSSSEAEGYDVPEPAIMPAGYDEPFTRKMVPPSPSLSPSPPSPLSPNPPSPEIEAAVLPAGYDKPATLPEPEPAVMPAGYVDPIIPVPRAKSPIEPPVEATQTALPGSSIVVINGEKVKVLDYVAPPAGPESFNFESFSVDVQVPEDGASEDQTAEEEEEEGVVVSEPGSSGAGEAEEDDGRAVLVNEAGDEEGAEDSYYDDDAENEEDEGDEHRVGDEEAHGRYDDDDEEEDGEDEDEVYSEEDSLSAVPEEESDAEDDQATAIKSGSKSPPAWFAGPSISQASSTSATPTAETDQLKPQTTKIPFTNRHAARTASPLGSQPPHIPQESSTPPISPVKPDAPSFGASGLGGFGGFGVKKQEVKDEAEQKSSGSLFSGKADAKPLFGFGMGKPSSALTGSAPVIEVKKEKEDVPAPAPTSTSGGFGFGAPKPTETSAQKPFGGFGFGLGQPPAAVAASSGKTSFDFAPSKPANKSVAPPAPLFNSTPATTGTPSPFSLNTGMSSMAPPSRPQAPTSAPQPSTSLFTSAPLAQAAPAAPKPTLPPPPPPPATSFTLPTRQKVPPTSQRRQDPKATMAGVLEGMISDLESEFKQITQVLGAAEKHHASLRDANFVKIAEKDLAKHKALPFSAVRDTSAIAESISKRLKEWKSQDTGVDRKLAELQSLLLKTDMRSGQLEQFAKARDDPSSFKVIEVTQLSAQQITDQAGILQAIEDVETGLEDLEMGLAGLKRRVDDAAKGIAPGSASVERLEHSVKKLDETIQERHRSLEDLAGRFSAIKLQPSSPRSPIRPPPQYISFGTPSTAKNSPTKRIALPVSADILADVKSAVDDDPVADLASRLGDRKTRTTTVASSVRSTLFSHSAKRAVQVDDVPQPVPPSHPVPKSPHNHTSESPAPSVVKDEPSSPTPASPSPFSGFSGITFSLDPGQIPRSAAGGSRQSQSSRAHAPAARLSTTTSGSTGTMPGGFGFDFAPPRASSPPVKKDGEPSGFFSLSGFSPK